MVSGLGDRRNGWHDPPHVHNMLRSLRLGVAQCTCSQTEPRLEFGDGYNHHRVDNHCGVLEQSDSESRASAGEVMKNREARGGAFPSDW